MTQSSRHGVFVSYSHKDEDWLERLQVHVSPFLRESDINWFDDKDIKPGTDWRARIEAALNSAKVIILLVSADFLASEFVATEEIPAILRAAEEEGALIMPLIIKPSRFLKTPSLSRFQSINPPDKPLASLKKWMREDFLARAADAVEEALKPPAIGEIDTSEPQPEERTVEQPPELPLEQPAEQLPPVPAPAPSQPAVERELADPVERGLEAHTAEASPTFTAEAPLHPDAELPPAGTGADSSQAARSAVAPAEKNGENGSDRRQAAALRSAHLDSAHEAYDEAFLTDQNHWYSGINAFALLSIIVSLAEREPGVWAGRFEREEEANAAIRRLQRERDELAAAVSHSLAAQDFRSRGKPYDVWADLTRADLRLLTSERPEYVAAAYERVRARMEAEGSGPFPAESAAQQIRMYLELGVFTEKAKAALAALGVDDMPMPSESRTRVVVFSGHRIDAPGREPPRFPPESVGTAERMIRKAVEKEKELAGAGPIEGIAGGASGGDILFHEICMELGIPTTLLLAIPPDDYAAASVADAGPEWMERYRRLLERLVVKVLSDKTERPRWGKPEERDWLPDWLRERRDYSVWQRNNRWTLHTALSRTDADVSLIVLWDGKGGDGPGGTQDMVNLARSRGVRVVILPAARLTEVPERA